MSRDDREEPLCRAVVGICDHPGKVIGTGFFVADDLVATCAHVIRTALLYEAGVPIEGGERIEIRLGGELPEGQEPFAARVERESFRDVDAQDVAFLRVEPRDRERLRELLGEIRPLTLATSQGLEGLTLRGWAYPEDQSGGHWMRAKLDGPLKHPRRGKRLQLSSWTIWDGCSGGPLWDEQGRVVGMAVSVVTKYPDTAFMIAAEELATAYRGLAIETVERRPVAIEDHAIVHISAQRVFFGGKEPAQPEREALRGQISQRFAEAVERGKLGLGASMEIGAALQRLLGPRGKWLETPGCRLASVEVGDDDREDLRLPLELLRPPTGAEPVLVRCALATTESAPEGPRSYPEGGRIVLATADAGGPVPDEALQQALHEVCRTGLHLASGSGDDRKRGAFEPALDHLPRVSRAALQKALGPHEGRPGAAVLELVCHVCEHGLYLHDNSGQQAVVNARDLATLLAPFASHLRLVVLVLVAERPQGDSGRELVDVALALHLRGLAAVVAPRVPLPAAASTGLTTALFKALLGDDKVAPASLEHAVVRANSELSSTNRPMHLGLRLWARAIDGDDTRPLVIRPYRNLLSFEAEHARFYFGRESETQRAVEKLAALNVRQEPQLLLLLGASGVGKSSMAKAGVVPALVEQGYKEILTRPSLLSGKDLEALVRKHKGKKQLVVVVDQLEDLFKNNAPPEEANSEAEDYLQRLWKLAVEAGVAVVLTLQNATLDAAVTVDTVKKRTLAQLAPEETNIVRVDHLDSRALRAVIVEPARRVGLELDEGLVNQLCSEALDPGALPMLELVLDELWLRREGRRIVTTAHEGGLAKRLADYATTFMETLPEAQREQARRILVRATTGPVVDLSKWRRRTTVNAIRPTRSERRTAFDAALDALVEARLVIRDLLPLASSKSDSPGQVDQPEISIELAHELLHRRWETLSRWIEEDKPRQVAITDLERWVADHHIYKTTLLTIEQLVYIERAGLSEFDDDLNPEMNELIKTSRRTVRRKKQRRRAATTALFFGFIFGIAGAYWANNQRNRAEANEAQARSSAKEASLAKQEADLARDDAITQLNRARDATWMAYAGAFKDKDPTRSLLGLREAQSRATANWTSDALHALQQPVAHVILPHPAQVQSAQYSRDSQRIVSISGDNTVWVWHTSGSEEPVVLQGHQAQVNSAAFSPDGTRIVTASMDKTARIWRTDDIGNPVVLNSHKEDVVVANFSPDGSRIVTASRDDTARVWRVGTHEQSVPLIGHGDDIIGADFSSDSNRIITASKDNTARIWDAGTGEELHTLRDHKNAVIQARFGPKDKHIITISLDGTARVWDADTGNLVSAPSSHEGAIVAATFSHDGTRVLTVSSDSIARIWRVLDGVELSASGRFEGDVIAASYSPDKTKIITTPKGATAHVWYQDRRWELSGHDDDITDAKFSPDGQWMLTTSLDKSVRVWRSSVTHRIPMNLRGHTRGVNSAMLSHDGRLVVTASSDRTTRLWDAKSGEPKGKPDGIIGRHDGEVYHASFSRDATKVVTASSDGIVSIWSIATDAMPVSFIAHEGAIHHASFNHDDTRIVTASADHTVRVWNADGSLLHELAEHSEDVVSAKFHPDGSRVLTASLDGTIRIWVVGSSQAPIVIDAYNDVNHAIFSPDGTKIAAALLNGEVKVWPMDDLEEVSVLGRFGSEATSVAFSADGQRIVASFSDSTVRVWQAEGGETVAVIEEYGAPVNFASLNYNGSVIITASDDLVARLWSIDDAALRSALDAATSACVPEYDRILYLGEQPEVARARFVECERGYGRAGKQ